MARTKGSNVQGNKVDKSPTGRTPLAARSPTRQSLKRFKPKVREDFVSSSLKKKGAVKPKVCSVEKGKDKMGSSPMSKRARTSSPITVPIDSESESISAETEIARAMAAVDKIRSTPKKQRTGKISSAPGLNSLPFLDENLDADVNQQKYEKHFREKPFCPAVSVNFETLKNDPELRLDLSEVLGHYECWLKIDDEFSPEVVKKFYCNMSDTTSDDNSEIIRTRLRGREIILSSEKLNELLGAPPVSSEPLQPLSVAEAQQILRQSDLVLPIEMRFKSSKMCDFYRIIHYIFSRSMISKSSGFSYLIRDECLLLARIIRGEKLDVGSMMFKVLKEFSSSKWQSEAYLPIPQVVSFILKKFNINHLHGDIKKKVDTFEKQHVKKMLISLPYDHKKSFLPPSAKDKGKRKVGSPRSETEPSVAPQSPSESFVPPTYPRNSFAEHLGARLETLFKGMKTELIEVKGAYQKIIDSHDQLRLEIAEVKNQVKDMRHEVDDIKNLMLLYINRGPIISEANPGGPSEHTAPVQELVTTPDLILEQEPKLEPQPSVTLASLSSPQPNIPEPSEIPF